MQKLIRKIDTVFNDLFDNEYILIRSPGRVNLIGEHTDYNDGFVLPAAIDKVIVLGMARNDCGKLRFRSIDMENTYETELCHELKKSGMGWPDYLLGVVEQLQKRGHELGGFDCAFAGDIPIGAGLSSSAALEGGVLFGLCQLFDWDISPVEMARIAQKAENDFVGVQCGIMDQFASLNGREGHALKLDCRTLHYEWYPLQRDDIKIVLCDTKVRRELASSEYNLRRQQCEKGVETLQQFETGIDKLRDASPELLQKHREAFDPVVFKRCMYVVEENQRVLSGCDFLKAGDMESFGACMYQSHEGLQHQYEVSCRELDLLVDTARTLEGVFGARMMGGGFGGCTINLVEEEQVESFTRRICKVYHSEMGQKLETYTANISDGTCLIGTEEIRA